MAFVYDDAVEIVGIKPLKPLVRMEDGLRVFPPSFCFTGRPIVWTLATTTLSVHLQF
jgi:hypothetical protein